MADNYWPEDDYGAQRVHVGLSVHNPVDPHIHLGEQSYGPWVVGDVEDALELIRQLTVAIAELQSRLEGAGE